MKANYITLNRPMHHDAGQTDMTQRDNCFFYHPVLDVDTTSYPFEMST
jgi:hypothetical protein